MSSPSPTRATTADCIGDCILLDLFPCFPAMIAGGTPIKACCDKLIAQKSCLCVYIQDPMLSPFVTTPNAGKVLIACKVPIPTCS